MKLHAFQARMIGATVIGTALCLAQICPAGAVQDKDKETPKAAPAVPAPATPPNGDNMPLENNTLIDRNHHLGKGDVIDIRVAGFEDLSRTVKLFADGTFDYPYLGTVQATGLTTRELADKIREGLLKQLRRPVVEVSLREIYRPPALPKEAPKIPKIVVLGEAARRGEIELPEPKPLRVVVAEVQPSEEADLTRVRIRYPDGAAQTANLRDIILSGNVEKDVIIRGGEEIVFQPKPLEVKPEPVKVTVLGLVRTPSTFEVDDETTILEALNKAGGVDPAADLERVEVTNPASKDSLIVNVAEYMSGRIKQGYTVKRGDVITVATKPWKILVLGEAAKPGELAIREGTTLREVYLMVGKSNSGDETKMELIRKTPGAKEPSRQKVNVRDIMKMAKNDVTLANQDVIFIPHKKMKRGFWHYVGAVVAPFWFLNSFGTGGVGGGGFGGGVPGNVGPRY